MFRTIPLSIIRSFSLYTQQWNMSYSSQQICMTHNIAVCTAINSWWWTEELSETCRILFQNKFEKLEHLVGLIIRIYHDARSPERQNICSKGHKICTSCKIYGCILFFVFICFYFLYTRSNVYVAMTHFLNFSSGTFSTSYLIVVPTWLDFDNR